MRWAGLVLATALETTLLAGCTGLPEEGPVVEAPPPSATEDDQPTFIDARPPQPNASAVEIVTGFLDAMTAYPVQVAVAKEFLATEVRASWDPGRETRIYADSLLPEGGSLQIEVQLSGVNVLDERGAWQGAVPFDQQELRFEMVRDPGDGDEWRIADPPNALIVPETWFGDRYEQVSLYFFEPTSSILVPEPIYVSTFSDTVASELVSALLEGPPPELQGVVRSEIPPGLGLVLSAPVADGLADITLAGGTTTPPSPERLELMLAQLAWTLRQVEGVEAFRLTIEGEPVQLPGGVTRFSVDEGLLYAPTGYQSSALLYGLEDGLLVSGQAQSLTPTSGPFGIEDYGLRSVAVDLDGESVVGVTSDGTTLLGAAVAAATPEGQQVNTLLSGATDLLRPAWDHEGRIWYVDRAPTGAVVGYLDPSGTSRVLEVDGVTGEDVRTLLVSRDGTRLVALLEDAAGDQVVAVRVEHDVRGDVRRTGAPIRLRPEDGARLQLKDIAWNSAATIAYLKPVSEENFEVATIAVDGAPTGLSSTNILGRVRALAGSPSPGQSLFAVVAPGVATGASLSDLTSGSTPLDPDVRAVVYPG